MSFKEKIRTTWGKIKAKFKKSGQTKAVDEETKAAASESACCVTEKKAENTECTQLIPDTEKAGEELVITEESSSNETTETQNPDGDDQTPELTQTLSKSAGDEVQLDLSEEIVIPADVSRTTDEYVEWQREQLEKDNTDA